MSTTRQKSNGSPHAQQEHIESALKSMSPAEIIEFDRFYRTLHYKAYAWNLWAAAYIVNGGCSDDCFSDFRGWLIGQGEKVYHKALANPDSLADVENLERDMDWEGYGYLAITVYEQVTGQVMPMPAVGHPAEPTGEEWEEDEAELSALLPKLFEKFGC